MCSKYKIECGKQTWHFPRNVQQWFRLLGSDFFEKLVWCCVRIHGGGYFCNKYPCDFTGKLWNFCVLPVCWSLVGPHERS